MKMYLSIDFNALEEYKSTIDMDALYLTFNSFGALQDFLNSDRKLNIDDLKGMLNKKDFHQVKKIKKMFERNLDDLLQNETIILYNIHLKDLCIDLLPNMPMVVNLTHLDVDELLCILHYSWPSSTLFKDLFNEVSGLLSKEDLLHAYQHIIKIASVLKPFNPTPAEIVFLAYDICRNRIFTKALEGEDKAIGRDLYKVVESDEIVCAGYVNLFRSICFFMGVTTESLYWASKGHDSGHISSIAYINDDVYNIHGILAFDPTANSKRRKDDKTFINNAAAAFVSLEKHLAVYNEKYDLYLTGLFGWLKAQISNFSQTEMATIIKCLNTIYTILGIELIDKASITIEELKERIFNLESDDNIIPLDTFNNLVHRVRSIEHAVDEDIPMDEVSIATLVASSASNRNTEIKDLARILQRLFDKEAI